MATLTDDQFPLPLSDYSRAKAVYAFRRALSRNDAATIERLERLAEHDAEPRHSLQSVRNQSDPQPEEEGNLSP